MRAPDIMELAAKIERRISGTSFNSAERINWIAQEVTHALQRAASRAAVEPPIINVNAPPLNELAHMAATIAGGMVSAGFGIGITATSATTIARNALLLARAIVRESKE